MKFLRKEFTNKTTVGKEMISSIIGSIVLSIMFYLIFTKLNNDIVTILNGIAEVKIDAINMTLTIFPAIIIVSLCSKIHMFIEKK